MKTKGFTLVELLVVIAILAILATVSVVGYTSFIDSAKDSNAETTLHTIETYIEADLLADNKFEVSETVTLTKTSTGYTCNATEANFEAALIANADIKQALAEGDTLVYDSGKLVFTTADGGNAEWAIGTITFATENNG